jgi:hypothetical protein
MDALALTLMVVVPILIIAIALIACLPRDESVSVSVNGIPFHGGRGGRTSAIAALVLMAAAFTTLVFATTTDSPQVSRWCLVAFAACVAGQLALSALSSHPRPHVRRRDSNPDGPSQVRALPPAPGDAETGRNCRALTSAAVGITAFALVLPLVPIPSAGDPAGTALAVALNLAIPVLVTILLFRWMGGPRRG